MAMSVHDYFIIILYNIDCFDSKNKNNARRLYFVPKVVLRHKYQIKQPYEMLK